MVAEAGLIRPRRQAQRVCYSVVPEALAHFQRLSMAYYDPANLPPGAAEGRGVDCPVPETIAQPAE